MSDACPPVRTSIHLSVMLPIYLLNYLLAHTTPRSHTTSICMLPATCPCTQRPLFRSLIHPPSKCLWWSVCPSNRWFHSFAHRPSAHLPVCPLVHPSVILRMCASPPKYPPTACPSDQCFYMLQNKSNEVHKNMHMVTLTLMRKNKHVTMNSCKFIAHCELIAFACCQSCFIQ